VHWHLLSTDYDIFVLYTTWIGIRETREMSVNFTVLGQWLPSVFVVLSCSCGCGRQCRLTANTDRCFYTYASVVNCWSSKSLSSSRWETAKTVTGIASTAAVSATDVSMTHRLRIYMAAQQKHSQGQKSTTALVFHVTRSPNRHATVEYDAQNQLFPPDWHHYRCRFSEHIGYCLYNVSQKRAPLIFFNNPVKN